MGTVTTSPPDTREARVPRELAEELSSACSLAMDGHQLSGDDVTAAREVLDGPAGRDVAARLAALAGRGQEGPGWAVLRMPADLDDEQLQRAGAGLLAALGRPFFSIRDGGRLWIGAETTAAKDPASFGGAGRQGLHIDAPNVERIPDYTSLLVLRPDPAGGGHSLAGDLHAALAGLSGADRDELAEPAYFEGRAEGLHGTGAPRMPFPVLDAGGEGPAWIRWAAKMAGDPRNGAHAAVLARYAAALESCATTVALDRGCLMILDQQRAAHGRTALGSQEGLPDGTRRLLLQAKAALDPAAPAQQPAKGGANDE
jgi:Taurine catabolism dioxygenase TauD, TfdA family